MSTSNTNTEQTTKQALQGLYLVEPHGRLIAEHRKTLIAKSKHLPLEGDWLLLSKDNGRGLEYGTITVGQPRMVTIDKFDSLFKYHRVTSKERSRWWPTKIELYLYPITELIPHDEPRPVEIPAGTQTIVEKIKYLDSTPSKPKEPNDVEPGQDRERPYSEVGAPRASDTHSDPAEKKLGHERKEVTMPYTSMENANPAIRGIKPPVTLAQANIIAGWADKIETADDDGARSPWAVAIAQFRKLYRVQAGKWVKERKGGEKAISLDDQSRAVRAAFHARFPSLSAVPLAQSSEMWVREIWSEFVIAESGANTYKVPYISSADEIVFAPYEEWQQVEQVWDEIGKKAFWSAARPEVKARGEGQGVGGPPQGDQGAELCVCPKCGHEVKHKHGVPCAEVECPECGTPMEGKSTKEPKDIEDAKEIEPEPKPEPNDMIYEPSDKSVNAQGATKGGRRLQSEKLGLLSSLKEKFESLLKDLGELIGWASYDDQKPAILGALFKESSGYVANKALDGRTWLLTWTTNAFEDREGEIFTTKSIEDYVARHANDDMKGRFDFWHLPGTEFGTIMWQGVEGRFLIESGPFDNTEIGRKAEEFFLAHPNGHPGIAPRGWGTSHQYKYREGDRRDGVYDWFEKTKTTILPFSVAANQHNPQQLEVMTVDAKQLEGLTGIWGPEVAAQIVALGKQQTEAKEKDGVAFKSVEGTEKPEDTEQKQDEGTKGDPTPESKELVQTVAEELQLGELSTAFKAVGNVVTTLAEQVKALETRMGTLEQDDETRLAQKETQLPRYSWFKASTAAETVLKEGDALKSAKPSAPSVVQNIAGKVA